MASSLPQTIRSAFFHDKGDLRIEQVEHPPLLPGHIAIENKFCGLCGSDLHFFHEQMFADTLKTPHPITGANLPIAMGHEFSGVVRAVGEGCKGGLKVGDKVAVMPTIFDGSCSACKTGATNVCRQTGFYGINTKTGGMGDGAVIPEDLVFKLPEGIDCDVGALVEPLAVAWHGISLVRDQITEDSTALIIGGGPIGAATLLGLRAKGVTRIAVSEPTLSRREFALQLGATASYNPLTDNVPAEAPKSLGAPDGVDMVFDCAGVGPTMDTGLACLRAKGTLINLFVSTNATTYYSFPMISKEITMSSSLAYLSSDFREVIAAIETGKMDPRPLITKRIRLEDVVKEGLETLTQKDNQNCKILIDMSL
ncbi:(R,R)-butanediol dehydrogenase [Cercospora beticola]|uniref:(R,R)-butanediol dehydrogenase n=1 Tax=Cercospora beticola TaxID=122368 RepID=A0A2G5HTL2_CERBT|nr:(R,R)-butanediol dehydrogenase [Cercospora beticola]PIA95868.1 (R,R)-butanediol dehydrogenase [Cercospora beticola]WPB07457.1 hypothetical protein RHO25_012118 [Cercospora beticola]CAK1367453.1 unnamed protein product [Cercospora beticola]